MIKASLINLFVAPITVHAARTLAKKHGAQDFFHQGIAVYCPAEHMPLIQESLNEVVQYFGDDWPRYCRNIKRVVIDEDVSSTLWFAARTLLIQSSDTHRMSSTAHMAGWLLADFRRIQVLREKHALHVLRSEQILQANKDGKRLRDEYLAWRSKG